MRLRRPENWHLSWLATWLLSLVIIHRWHIGRIPFLLNAGPYWLLLACLTPSISMISNTLFRVLGNWLLILLNDHWLFVLLNDPVLAERRHLDIRVEAAHWLAIVYISNTVLWEQCIFIQMSIIVWSWTLSFNSIRCFFFVNNWLWNSVSLSLWLSLLHKRTLSRMKWWNKNRFWLTTDHAAVKLKNLVELILHLVLVITTRFLNEIRLLALWLHSMHHVWLSKFFYWILHWPNFRLSIVMLTRLLLLLKPLESSCPYLVLISKQHSLLRRWGQWSFIF